MKDKKVSRLLDELEMYSNFTMDDLEKLYNLTQKTEIEYSAALTVFNESHIAKAYRCLDNLYWQIGRRILINRRNI